mgnify:CR=1 FL=1
MKFELDLGARWPIIRSYGAGEFRIADQRHTSSLVLSRDQVRTDLLPAHAGMLTAAHLDTLCDLGADLLVIGTGARSSFLSQALLARVLARGVGCEVMSTAAACRSYNVLVAEGRSVAAALFIIAPD